MQTLEKRIQRIYDHTDYWPQLRKDLLAATARVVIESPFITKNGIDRWEPLLLELKRRGIFVRIIARKPKLYDRTDRQDAAAVAERQQFDALVARLKTLADEVVVRDGIHPKFVLIDGHLIWEGSLNYLSHWDSTEHLRRTTDLDDIKEICMRHKLTETDDDKHVEAL